MNALPVRWKFALWSAGLVGVVVLIFAAATFLNLHHEQLEAVDLELVAASQHIAGLSQATVVERTLAELVRFQPWLGVAVFDADGRILRRTDSLPEPIARAALQHSDVQTAHDKSGQGWRVVSFEHTNSTIALAYSLEELDEIIRDLVISYTLAIPVVLLVAAVGGWWVSGRALVGLRDLTVSAEDIRADQLHRRIPVPAANDEIRRLVDVLNTMLARLETSFEQAKRFAADASHELRTPLTIIDGEISRLLRTPDLPKEAEDLALSAQEEISRLERITEQMLLLAQFDAGTASVPQVAVNLSELVREACEDAELLVTERALAMETRLSPDIIVMGEPGHLRRLALNLLENAVRYNMQGGKVICRLSSSDGRAILTVGNSGPGIPLDARGKLFQRFFRSDLARSRGGHGLGLSLCQEIVRAHGGTIALVGTDQRDWTEFAVALPCSDHPENRGKC